MGLIKGNRIFVQYNAALCANIASLIFGVSMSWSSPYEKLLTSEDTPLHGGPITKQQMGWIVSAGSIGGFVSVFIFGWLVERIGRKRCLVLIGIPQTISWLLLLFGRDFYAVLSGRILGGFAGGGAFFVIPIFVTEIAEDQNRGTLGSILSLCCNSGIFFGFVITTYFNYFTVSEIVTALSVLYTCCICFFAESPEYLLARGRREEAVKAFAFYRNILPDKVTASVNQDAAKTGTDDKKKLTCGDFWLPESRRGIFLAVIVILFPAMTGTFVMIAYTASIFEEAGSKMSEGLSSIIVALIQIFGSYVSTFLVDRAGRRILIIISAVGSALSLSLMGTYYYLRSIQVDTTAFSMVPLVCFSVLVFMTAIGMAPLPFFFINEILPLKIRGTVTAFCMTEMNVYAFLQLLFFASYVDWVGMHGFVWTFAIQSAFAAIFTFLFVPETKGKSIDAIVQALK